MGPVDLTGLVIGAGVIAISWRRADARLAALCLVALNITGICMRRLGVADDLRLTINLTLDTLAAVGFVLAWRIIWPPRNWLFVLALTFFGQVTAHRAYDGHAGSAYTLQLLLNLLAFAQLATVVIGPRAGQLIGSARNSFHRLLPAPSHRVRGRGVVAAFEGWIERRGAAALRSRR